MHEQDTTGFLAAQWPRIAAGTAAALLAGSSFAGAFSVSPVRIYMQSRERATAITIVNEADTELVMQAELFTWKQKPDGTDELTPTDDLVLAPPILKLPPKGRQVVRLANLRPVLPGEQQTYRMIVREIPEALAQQPNVQVQVALAFSLPVFITPPNAQRDLVCTVQRAGPQSVAAHCENRGQAYAQPVNFTLTTASGEVLANKDVNAAYVLPQVKRSFELTKGDSRIPSGPAKLAVSQDDGTKQIFDVLVAD